MRLIGIKRPASLFALLSLLLILFLIVIRFFLLDIDPPLFFKGYTQAHLTDPYHLTHYARNKVLFNDWDPFDFHRWDVFKYSLVNGTAYIVFSLFGVSRVTANIAGLILNLSGLLLFLTGLGGKRESREILLTAILLFLSSMLFFYGRMPFLENGLIFWSGFLFFIFNRFYDRWYGQFVSGFIVALAALSGKLFGLILVVPVMAGFIYMYRRRSAVPIILSVGGIVSGGILFLLVFFGGGIEVLKRYYLEQTFGMYGSPDGLSSPLEFIKNLILYGAGSGFYDFSPFMLVMAAAGLLMLYFSIPLKNEPDRIFLPLIFSAVWLFAGILGLMPHNYWPLRYAVFLLMPTAAICGYTAGRIFDEKIELRISAAWLIIPMAFLTIWYTLTQISLLYAPYNLEIAWGKKIMPFTMIVSLPAVLGIYYLLKKKKRLLPKKSFLVAVIILAAGIVYMQGTNIYRGLRWPGRYLKEISVEIGGLLYKDAVLTGPYAPAVAIDNKLKVVIYNFGLSDVEYDLFDKFPISHIATGRYNWDLAREHFPFLKSSTELTLLTIREFMGGLFRVPNAAVPMTDFEKGATFLVNLQADSGVVYLEKFVAANDENLLGVMALGRAYGMAGQIDRELNILKKLPERYPDNFRIHVYCSKQYHNLFKETGRLEFNQMTSYHSRRARSLNPVAE